MNVGGMHPSTASQLLYSRTRINFISSTTLATDMIPSNGVPRAHCTSRVNATVTQATALVRSSLAHLSSDFCIDSRCVADYRPNSCIKRWEDVRNGRI